MGRGVSPGPAPVRARPVAPARLHDGLTERGVFVVAVVSVVMVAVMMLSVVGGVEVVS